MKIKPIQRTWAKEVSPMASAKHPCGKIVFIHKDGKEHTFGFAVNKMTGSHMSWWDNNPPDIGESLDYIKTVFRDIKNKSKDVLECIGDYA
jgi:hypothetical protein